VHEARALALQVLSQCERGRIPCDAVLGPRLASCSLSERDRRLVTTLVRHTHRWRGRADRVLDKRLTRGLRSLDLSTLTILRIGYVQLFHLDQIPPHAAVHTSVDLCRRQGGDGKAGLVNQVLRGLLRHGPTPGEWGAGRGAEALEGELSHPHWLIERWLDRWGEEETRRVCEWNNGEPDFHLRVHGGEEARARVSRVLAKEDRTVTPGALLTEVLRVAGSFQVREHPLLKSGTLSPQDESQALVGRLWPDLAAGPVLDMCAGPGTKGAHLAELSPQATILAADLTHRRTRRVADTRRRLGLDNLFPVVSDGRRPAFRSVFRRVLLDAPCSGLGVLRRRPDARWLRSPGEIADAASLQHRLLDAAAELVAPGAHLLYSVCSLEPEESSLQVERFLERHPEFETGELPAWLPDEIRPAAGTVTIRPGHLGMEGMFASLLHKARSSTGEGRRET
jgi:16S rRNA (cytosine967-C5)-methyltransferase